MGLGIGAVMVAGCLVMGLVIGVIMLWFGVEFQDLSFGFGFDWKLEGHCGTPSDKAGLAGKLGAD